MYGDDGKIVKHRGKDQRRPPNTKTPCRTCPKKSPDEAHQYELSPKNEKAVQFYFATRAMSGANLTDELKQDAIVQRNLSIIDRIIRQHEQESAVAAVMNPLIAHLMLSAQTGPPRAQTGHHSPRGR